MVQSHKVYMLVVFCMFTVLCNLYLLNVFSLLLFCSLNHHQQFRSRNYL